MNSPFLGDGQRRAVLPEVSAWIARAAGGTLVNGLAAMVDRGDARVGAQRVAGFMETHDPLEWALPMGSRRGLCFATEPVPENLNTPYVIFHLSMGFGNGSPLPQPSGRFEVAVNGRRCLSIRKVNHSQLWKLGDCRLAFAMRRCETAPSYGAMTLSAAIENESQAAFGIGLLRVPSSWVAPGKPAHITVTPAADNRESTRYFYMNTASWNPLGAAMQHAVRLLTGEDRPVSSGYNLYFGDIHTHSGQVGAECGDRGCGTKTWAENYANARDAGGLDFFALTDHEWQIEPGFEEEYFSLPDRHETPGEFVCLPAFEHTSLLYGHRNVYFKRGGIVVNSNRKSGGRPTMDPADSVEPAQLFRRLTEHGQPFFTVPHHPSAASHPFSWDFFSPHDRLVEVYSAWGSSDYHGDFPRGVSDRHEHLSIQEAMCRGLKFGLIASSDGHEGYPGDESSPHPKHPHLFHFCGSGRSVVLARSLTREAVFDALYERRCYGTTGPPIGLEFTVNGACMGQTVLANGGSGGGRPRLVVTVRGTNSIDHVRILKNGRVVHVSQAFGSWSHELEWEDDTRADHAPAAYTVRVVQQDRESAWSSPVWVE